MKRILIGTTNLAKLEEIRKVISGEDLEIVSLRDFPVIKQAEETGETFEENAILKAKGYFEQTGIPTIADDGGLAIEVLGGLPGVHSNRWLGHEGGDQELADAVLEHMKDVPQEKRVARLGGVMIFYDGKEIFKSENWVDGHIADRMLTPIAPGFPYRSILIVDRFQKAYGELSEEEHAQLNHRWRNITALKHAVLERLASA